LPDVSTLVFISETKLHLVVTSAYHLTMIVHVQSITHSPCLCKDVCHVSGDRSLLITSAHAAMSQRFVIQYRWTILTSA